MIFEFDRYIDGRPYPNLAQHEAKPFTPGWRKFSHRWPYSEPPHLLEYLEQENVTLSYDGIRIYLISVSYFDFDIDWYSIIPNNRKLELQRNEIYLAFFYSEGDNPHRLRTHLEQQCRNNGVDPQRLILISANSAAEHMPGSVWFADDELLFRRRNRHHTAVNYSEHIRPKHFTALVRTHKWWRATIMADFWRRGWHELGYFSYNPGTDVGESEHDNPIEVDRWPGLRQTTYDFLLRRFRADALTAEEHNDHHLSVPEHFSDSYINIVLETHMDADASHGVFLTEKIFKPIKHCQPFVIFGCANTLEKLRQLGYRTFDHVLDNSYDNIADTTQRYHAIMAMLDQLFKQGSHHLYEIYRACHEDLVHNQQHFLASKSRRLNTLLERISCACNHTPVGNH